MKLESEFLLCLQRHLLEQAFHRSCLPSPVPIAPSLSASTWVKLVEPPTPFSADEALLLCQASETEWVAWIPDYGEILLKIEQINLS
ncbi:MAG TPA: hypothetical protein V6D18_12330 [Thermosynechococcaceae cyanobacterium]|jgi:hypothetical protein